MTSQKIFITTDLNSFYQPEVLLTFDPELAVINLQCKTRWDRRKNIRVGEYSSNHPTNKGKALSEIVKNNKAKAWLLIKDFFTKEGESDVVFVYPDKTVKHISLTV